MVVLDTSALLFWTLEPKRLSARASREIDASERRLVSSISVWEIGIKVARGKLRLPLPVRDYATRLAALEGVEILAVDLETWLATLDLSWEHRDPADRTIVATAQLRGCPLITSDSTILAFYPDAIW